MTRTIFVESEVRIVVKVFRKGRPDRIFEYFYNLGAVSKQHYKEEKNELFNYIVKNRKQLVRENKELLKKMKRLEVC